MSGRFRNRWRQIPPLLMAVIMRLQMPLYPCNTSLVLVENILHVVVKWKTPNNKTVLPRNDATVKQHPTPVDVNN